jgi:hypothetical protein
VCTDLLSYAELACGLVHVRRLEETNKEEKKIGGRSPTLG